MQTASLEAFVDGTWQKMGVLTYGSVLGLEYDSEYIAQFFDWGIGYQCSLQHPVKFWPFVHEKWPAFLYDLMPSGYGRRALISVLGGQDSPRRDWEVLTFGASHAPGNLRIREAREWMLNRLPKFSGPQITNLKALELSDIQDFMQVGFLPGGSPVGGEAPKLVLTQSDEGYYFSALQESGKHWIVKCGFSERQATLLASEYLYLLCAKNCGLNVYETPGLMGNHLLIPRFDRVEDKIYPMHSAYNILGVPGYGIFLKHEEILARLAEYISGEELFEDCLEYLKRDLLSEALQVLDNHGRNTAFLIRDHKLRLSPLFDFSPMYLSEDPPYRSTQWEARSYQDLLADNGLFNQLGLDSRRLRTVLKDWEGQFLYGITDLIQNCSLRVREVCEPRVDKVLQILKGLT
ncbi:MAG: HipA domain-containing protein [Candidatus Cloacimonetes bacterium]|nr:HipA domain-containing protein [Candidatus Cloacimonadota bacterium]